MPDFPPKLPVPSLTDKLTNPFNVPKYLLNNNDSATREFNQGLFYNIDPSNWYKTFPFAFEIEDDKDMLCRFFLPIPPQNYTIQDMSAAEAHATIGGVVEEVSQPVFSMITLVGTTGLALNSTSLGNGIDVDLNIQQRKILEEVTKADNPISKVFKEVVDQAAGKLLLSFVEQEQELPYQTAPSAINTPASGIVESLFENAQSPSPQNFFQKINPLNPFKTPEIILNEFTNGWAWSQALRQFFLIYQREREKNTNLELYFSDYKSRSSYRCVPRSIQFQQNSNNPYLINYTIILKCWSLKDAQNEDYNIKNVNRFSTDLKEVYTTSISGGLSNLGKVCKNLNRVPSVAGSFLRNSVGSFL